MNDHTDRDSVVSIHMHDTDRLVDLIQDIPFPIGKRQLVHELESEGVSDEITAKIATSDGIWFTSVDDLFDRTSGLS